MTEYTVVKEFKIVNRRLAPGAIVTEADDFYPFELNERLESGFIKLTTDEFLGEVQPAPPTPVKPKASSKTEAPAD